MSGILEVLEQRVQETKRALDDAHKRVQQAMDERDIFSADLQGYERALAAEKRRLGIEVDGPPLRETRIEVQDNLGTSNAVEVGSSEISKAEFARRFVRNRAETGATPGDIYRGFVAAGIAIRKPYIYSLVQRLQAQNAIKERRGKYYPADPMEQSQGTAQ